MDKVSLLLKACVDGLKKTVRGLFVVLRRQRPTQNVVMTYGGKDETLCAKGRDPSKVACQRSVERVHEAAAPGDATRAMATCIMNALR